MNAVAETEFAPLSGGAAGVPGVSDGRAPAFFRVCMELHPVMRAAAADGHCPILPTHEIVKDGEIVGAVSLGSIPLVHVWTHTQKIRALESVRLLKQLEKLARRRGNQVMCLPCSSSSPYFPVMERLGFLHGGQMHLFYKQL